jgi:hypothetical protein
MTVPLYARSVAAIVGGVLVLIAWSNVIGTLIVPRPLARGLGRRVARMVNGAFRLATSLTADYQQRDRMLARQAATILVAQLAAWLGPVLAQGPGRTRYDISGGQHEPHGGPPVGPEPSPAFRDHGLLLVVREMESSAQRALRRVPGAPRSRPPAKGTGIRLVRASLRRRGVGHGTQWRGVQGAVQGLECVLVLAVGLALGRIADGRRGK